MTGRRHATDVMDRHIDADRVLLEAEVEQVRREARRRFAAFVLDHANPGTVFRNRQKQPLDPELFRQAGELGLIGFSLPTEVGGEGRDKLAWGVVVEELARLSLDPNFAVLIDITVEITELILSSGKPELIDRYVADLVAGRRFGVQGAYESRDPYDYRSTARQEGDEWVLNGAKRFVAGARFADLFILFLRDETSNDMLAFAVEKDDPGVSAVHLETMGLHVMGLGQVLLHEVRLPHWRLVWRADALSELNTYARIRRTVTACGVLGELEGMIAANVEALAPRRRTGRRVLDYPNVERSIGELRTLLQTARATVYRALDHTRAPGRDPYFDEYATVAKYHASECAVRAGELLMTLQGGESYMADFPWERFMRDVLGLLGGQGSQELLLIQLGQRTIVGLEGDRVREEAAERAVAKLCDAWWALHAAALPAPSPAAAAVTAAAKPTEADLDGLPALLDRAHQLLAEVRAGRVPEQLPPPPAGKLARAGWALPVCVAALATGLLTRLLEPATLSEAADELPKAFTEGVLEVLTGAGLVRLRPDGRYATEAGLERVLIGGPRSTSFAARLDRAVSGAAALRAGTPPEHAPAGTGGEAPALVDALVNTVLGRLEGLSEQLARPDARIGCLARDGGASAAALSRQLPHLPVLTTLADDLALTWLPTAGLDDAALQAAVTTAAGSLTAGGWLVLPVVQPPKRPLGAAVASLDSEVSGGAAALAADALDTALRAAGLAHLRTLWEEPSLGIRLVAARRP
ncbi:acyl-CoA dehydrogenase family protein [Kitasatospora viridis]|uniref:Alkylation response protein AidB-like acyl-CoA dehydrogenase n=1 Tax=Kitasatospora viridis TaxID=281105 RepID=A0A561UC62_9ACTN|nr:acyl-CoA dehydrogenase family protein [Kitasatospora viridis]TWF96948.1 alkylation response protein AidB-like acyl-CoA dehydrogenase [Kitasatospora viridis]